MLTRDYRECSRYSCSSVGTPELKISNKFIDALTYAGDLLIDPTANFENVLKIRYNDARLHKRVLSHSRNGCSYLKSQAFIISASIRVVHWNLNRNILLDIVLKGYPTTQTRSPLRIFHDVNWAYAPRLWEQFFVRNILNNRKIKCNAVSK